MKSRSVLIVFGILFSTVLVAQNIVPYKKDFVPFKDYPNLANSKFKQVKVTDEVPNWDMAYLYSSTTDPKIMQDVEKALKDSELFKVKYNGKVKEEKLTPAELLDAVKEYEAIEQGVWLPQEYVANSYNINLNDADLAAMTGKIEEVVTELASNLSFFENEITALNDPYKSTILSSTELADYKNWLTKLTDKKKHLLPQDQEELLVDKDVNGVSALVDLRQKFVAKFSFMFKGPKDTEPKAHTLTDLIGYLELDNRELRYNAMETFLQEFKRDSYFFAKVYNSLIGDKIKIDEKRRGYYPMISMKNNESQLDDAVVETMQQVTVENYKLAQRYWKLKAKLLGIKDFNNADVKAPYVLKDAAEKKYSFTEALSMIQKIDDAFYKPYGNAFENVYRCGLIDAKPSTGKRGGAYCDSFGIGYPPVILTNFAGSIADVSTIAHEGGHWINFLLIAQNQKVSNVNIATAIAETASVFNEMLLSERLLDDLKDNKKEQLVFLISKLDGMIASVFRQTAFSKFEQSSFKAREEGPLTPDQFADIFAKEYGSLFGDAVQMTPNFKYEWERIPHFMTPFYVYSYSFGQLATIALYQKYLDNKKTFPARYMDFLSAGSSLNPQDLFKKMDIDLSDKSTWENGFKYISSLIDKAEKLADEVK